MGRRSVRARSCFGLLTALQLLLPGAAAWADARLDADSSLAVAHVEAHTTASCVRIHPADCAFHRFLSTPLATGGAVAVSAGSGALRSAGCAFSDVALSAPRRRLPDSRAPPLLS